jgi:hypothetical protein
LFGVTCPLTPDPSPPFHGGEGRKSGQWSVSCRAVGSHAKPRSREGNRRVGLRVVTGGIPAAHPSTAVAGSPGGDFCSSGFPARAHRVAFLIAWGGRFLGWLAPSPPTPLPRFTGARGGRVVSELQGGGSHAKPRSREGRGKRAVGVFRVRVRVPFH